LVPQVNIGFFAISPAAAFFLWMAGCNGLNEPFSFDNATGSCQYTTPDGHDSCEDFLGSEYNQSVAQNACATGNGTWSPNACATAGAVGTCAVDIGSAAAQNVQYTYYADPGAGPATVLAAETACGLLGGTFAAK
jgi:hypothetical protein